jgi:predicted RNA binding protein YcfA (HicA-like mRNA interferase family)
MKKRDLERHLRQHHCDRHRNVGKHEIWLNRATRAEAAVPRHREIPPGTVRSICRQLGITVPIGK